MKSDKYVSVCAKTHIGLKRKNNEDNYLIVTEGQNVRNYGMLFAVADGMGGHAHGEIASKLACEGLSEYFKRTPVSRNGMDICHHRIHQLKVTIHQLHNHIIGQGLKHQDFEGMGTTLSALVLLRGKALIAHIGDSRIYRLRQNRLERLTIDHTMAQFLIEESEISPEDAVNHPARHVLTQALGIEIEKVETRVESTEPGDLFLLCSDGLYDMVSDDDLLKILIAPPREQSVCGTLLNAAMNSGGKDNLTVIVVKIKDSLKS